MGGLCLSFWHVDCVRKIGLKAFTERYKAFCKKHHYNFQLGKPEKLFASSKELVAVFPKEKTYKLLIQQSIQQLNLASEHVEQLLLVYYVSLTPPNCNHFFHILTMLSCQKDFI